MLAASALLLLLILRAQAQELPPSAIPPFPQVLAGEVFTQALSFMAPRTLEAIPMPTLALWGLHGLSALDPSLTADISSGTLRLASPERVLAVEPAPAAADYNGWGRAIALLAAVAWQYSPPVREVGESGVFEAFFDELFNHFDPYSRYVPPKRAALDRKERSGSTGTGVLLAKENGAIVITGVIAGSPAEKAGIRIGLRVLSVNRTSTAQKTAAAVEDAIAAAPGPRVTLTLLDPADGKVEIHTVLRTSPPPETVFAQRDHDMLIVRITAFDRTTGPHLANEISSGLSVANAPQGIVLDLRGNRGGLLDQAVYSADVLLRRGVIATTNGRDPAARHVWYAAGADMADDLPIIVVVDGLTASAAEIVSAALADNGRAVVVGSSTLGKGLVQTIDSLPDGGELFVTWSRVLAPRGWPIQGLGVLPQVCTSRGRPALDRQLAALAGGVQPMARALYNHDTARAPVSPAQILAIRSACPAAVGSEADFTAAQSLIDNPAAYAAALLPPSGRALAPPP